MQNRGIDALQGVRLQRVVAILYDAINDPTQNILLNTHVHQRGSNTPILYMMQLMILHRILCSILSRMKQILFDPRRPVCGHLKNHTKYQRMSIYLTGYSSVEIMNTNCREGRKGILNTASTLYTEGVPGGCRPEAGTHRGPDKSG